MASAGCAFFVWNTGQAVILMAFFTFNINVFAGQWIICFCVIDLDLFPALR